MEYNKKLFWKVTLAIFIILFASTFFFLVAQLQRHHIFVIQPQTVHTNIGIAFLCIGSAFVLYYILNRKEFFWFFERREAAIRAMATDPEKNRAFLEWQKTRNIDLALKVLLIGGISVLIVSYTLSGLYAIICLAAILGAGFLIFRWIA